VPAYLYDGERLFATAQTCSHLADVTLPDLRTSGLIGLPLAVERHCGTEFVRGRPCVSLFESGLVAASPESKVTFKRWTGCPKRPLCTGGKSSKACPANRAQAGAARVLLHQLFGGEIRLQPTARRRPARALVSATRGAAAATCGRNIGPAFRRRSPRTLETIGSSGNRTVRLLERALKLRQGHFLKEILESGSKGTDNLDSQPTPHSELRVASTSSPNRSEGLSKRPSRIELQDALQQPWKAFIHLVQACLSGPDRQPACCRPGSATESREIAGQTPRRRRAASNRRL
jgi:hypothetical protein